MKKIDDLLESFYGWPRIDIRRKIADQLDELLGKSLDDFFYAYSFAPALIAESMWEGFLPTGTSINGTNLFTPKLHLERSVVFLDELRINKSILRKAKSFTFSINHNFPKTLSSCVIRHGQGWLLDEIIEGFLKIYHSPPDKRVNMYSFDVWLGDTLAAGEIGYSIGSIYTSLSGFYEISGAGSVQLACTGTVLRQAGFKIWDFGMPLWYKGKWGAVSVPRTEFIKLVHKYRINERKLKNFPRDAEQNCYHLIVGA